MDKFILENTPKGRMYDFGDEKPYWCDSCSVGFVFEIQLFEHVNLVHCRDALRDYRIPRINKGSVPGRNSVSPLQRVEYLHKPVPRRPKFRCTICRRCFLFASELSAHLRRVHLKEVHVCRKCGKGFRKRGRLLLHTREHREARPYVCYTCWERFRSLHLLRVHAKTHSDLKGGFGIELYGTKSRKNRIFEIRHSKSRGKALTKEDKENDDCSGCNRSEPDELQDIDVDFNDICEDEVSVALAEDFIRREATDSPDVPGDEGDVVEEDDSRCVRQVVSVESMWNEDIPAMPFRCALCDQRFVAPEELTAHVPLHISGDKYKCLVCKKTYKNASRLRQHVRSFHMTQRPYECTFCDKAFYSSSALKMHKKVHAWPQDCEVCGRSYPNRRRMRDHARVHSAEVVYTCKFCGEMYLAKSTLTRHINMIHCSDGEKATSGTKTISQETQDNLGKLAKTMKDISPSSDDNTMILTPEMRMISLNTEIVSESGQNLRKCALCDKVCSNIRALKVHLKKHQCKYCKAMFKSPSSVSEHIASAHAVGRPYCELCSIVFSSSTSLSKHNQLKHMPDVTIECPKCKKCFATFDGVNRHCRMIHPDMDRTLLVPKKRKMRVMKSESEHGSERATESATPEYATVRCSVTSPGNTVSEVDVIEELPDLEWPGTLNGDEAVDKENRQIPAPGNERIDSDSLSRVTTSSQCQKSRMDTQSIDSESMDTTNVEIQEVNNNSNKVDGLVEEECRQIPSRPSSVCTVDYDSHESVTDHENSHEEPRFLTPSRPLFCVNKVEELTDNESDISELEVRKSTSSVKRFGGINTKCANGNVSNSRATRASPLSLHLSSSSDDDSDKCSTRSSVKVTSMSDLRKMRKKLGHSRPTNLYQSQLSLEALSDDDDNDDYHQNRTADSAASDGVRGSADTFKKVCESETESETETKTPVTPSRHSRLSLHLSSSGDDDDDDDADIINCTLSSDKRMTVLSKQTADLADRHRVDKTIRNGSIPMSRTASSPVSPSSTRHDVAEQNQASEEDDVSNLKTTNFKYSRTCTKCNVFFISFDLLWRHYVRKHLTYYPLVCDQCARILSDVSDFEHRACGLRYVCLDCKCVFNQETGRSHSLKNKSHRAGWTGDFQKRAKICSRKINFHRMGEGIKDLSTGQSKSIDMLQLDVRKSDTLEHGVRCVEGIQREGPLTGVNLKSKAVNEPHKKERSLFEFFEDLSSESEPDTTPDEVLHQQEKEFSNSHVQVRIQNSEIVVIRRSKEGSISREKSISSSEPKSEGLLARLLNEERASKVSKPAASVVSAPSEALQPYPHDAELDIASHVTETVTIQDSRVVQTKTVDPPAHMEKTKSVVPLVRVVSANPPPTTKERVEYDLVDKVPPKPVVNVRRRRAQRKKAIHKAPVQAPSDSDSFMMTYLSGGNRPGVQPCGITPLNQPPPVAYGLYGNPPNQSYRQLSTGSDIPGYTSAVYSNSQIQRQELLRSCRLQVPPGQTPNTYGQPMYYMNPGTPRTLPTSPVYPNTQSTLPPVRGSTTHGQCSCFECVYASQFASSPYYRQPCSTSASYSQPMFPAQNFPLAYHQIPAALNNVNMNQQAPMYSSSFNCQTGTPAMTPRFSQAAATNMVEMKVINPSSSHDSGLDRIKQIKEFLLQGVPISKFEVHSQTAFSPDRGTASATGNTPQRSYGASGLGRNQEMVNDVDSEDGKNSDREYVIASNKSARQPSSVSNDVNNRTNVDEATCEDSDVVIITKNGLIEEVMKEVARHEPLAQSVKQYSPPKSQAPVEDPSCCMFCHVKFQDELSLVKHVIDVHS